MQRNPFIIDTDKEFLSAREEIRQILIGDRVHTDPEQTSLFRNPRTGNEIAYSEFRAIMQWAFREAGLESMGGRMRSFRVGGATTYANSPSGCAIVAGFMGLWKSKSQLDCI